MLPTLDERNRMHDQETENKLLVLQGLIRAADAFEDKAAAIEETLGMDLVFSLLAIGHSENDMARSLGLDADEFNYLVKQSSSHRDRYLKAKAFLLSDKSVDVMTAFNTASMLEDEEKRALDYHSKNLDRALKMGDDTSQMSGMIINNILTIRDKNDIPALPEEIKDIVDAEFTESEI